MSDLRVKIGADTADFDRKMKGMSSTIKNVAGILGAGVSAGVAVGYVKTLINGLDEISDKSKNLGVTAEFFQKLDFAAARSGSSVEAAANGIKFMSKNISDAASGTGDAKKAFDLLGISVSQIKTLSPEQQFEQISKAISSIGDQGDKTNMAMKIFGKSGAELITMMKDYSGLAAELEASGSLISDENISAAEAFNDALTNMSKSIQAMVAGSGFIGWLADVADMIEKATQKSKLGSKTGIGAPGSAGYRGGFGGFVSNMIDVAAEGEGSFRYNPIGRGLGIGLKKMGFGEQEGAQVKAEDTEADTKKLKDAKKLFDETGKSLTQRNAEAEAARKLAFENEKLAEAKAKAAKEQAKLDDKTSQTLEDMNQEIELQILKNHGLEKEAAIQKALYDARKQNAGLSDYEAKQIADMTGSLFDLSEERDDEKDKKDPLAKLRDMPEISNQFLRVGAFMGGDYKTGGQNLEQKQVGLLEKIERNTAGFQSTDLTLV